jgi:hypothetical protein
VNQSMFELADQYKELKDRKKQLEDQLKEINAQIESIQRDLAIDMINEEIGNFKRGDFIYVLTTKTHVSPKAGCKPKLIEWLKQSEYSDMVKEDVHSRTLESWARELLENEELPEELEDLLNVYEKQTVTIRKSK